jgi:hypothetical protein
MRRLITLVSAGRNRIVVIRRELPRTENADWDRTEHGRILLAVRSDPVTCTAAPCRLDSMRRRSAKSKPAIPSSQEKGGWHRRQVPSRPNGNERKRVAVSHREALTGGGEARRSCRRECLSLRLKSGFGLNGNGPDESQQFAAYRSDDLRLRAAVSRPIITETGRVNDAEALRGKRRHGVF